MNAPNTTDIVAPAENGAANVHLTSMPTIQPLHGAGEHEPGSRESDAACGAEAADQIAADSVSGSNLTMISIELIDTNDYNPNKMEPKDYRVLVEATKQKSRNPMPIKVRQMGSRYVIINGEHNFKAALEAGLIEVLCEIEVVDRFEAMRQTLDYYRHGKHDPFLEGLMYQEMLEEKNLSQREHAKELKCSDGKVRNGLKFVEAVALRIGCDPEEARNMYAEHAEEVERISSLSNTQVRMYVDMPACFRDRWLDAGADMGPLKDRYVFDQYKLICTGAQLVDRLTDSGLLHHVDPGPFFAKSLEMVAELDLWCGDHIVVEHLFDYAHPVIENKLPVKLLENLPLEPAGNAGMKVTLSAQEWADIIVRCCSETKNTSCRFGMISAAVNNALVDAGHDLAESLSGRELKMLETIMQEAPQCILDASFMSIEERYRLHRASPYADQELVLKAKELTVEQFTSWRTESSDDTNDGEQRGVLKVFDEQLSQLRRERTAREEVELFKHRDKLLDKIIDSVRYTADVADVKVDGRQALDLMRDDLEASPPQALALMAACVMPSRRPAAIMHWFNAKCG